MELRDPLEETVIWDERGKCADSDTVADEEEALSLRDLPLCNQNQVKDCTFRDSNAGCSDHTEDFNFEFGLSSSMADQVCPADDLFRQGRLLPVAIERCRSESNAQFSYGKSNCCSENRRLLNEKLQAWRIDSLDSQTTYRTTSPGNSQYLQRKKYTSNLPPGNSATPFIKSESKPNRTSPKLPSSATKMPLKWQQFFTLGLIKTPPMKLEDLRLRQGNPKDNGVESQILKRSVSCNYEEVSKLREREHRGIIFGQKSKSVKESRPGEEKQGRSKGWSMLSPLTSSNGCKASTNSVVNCTKKMRS